MVKSPLKTIRCFHKELNLLYNLILIFLNTYPEKMKTCSHKDSYIIVYSSIICRSSGWKQYRCSNCWLMKRSKHFDIDSNLYKLPGDYIELKSKSKRLCTVWFHLYNILEKTKYWTCRRDEWLSGLAGGVNEKKVVIPVKGAREGFL